MPVCYFCQAPFARCRCGQCRQVYFCNRECQIGAWPSHRPECHPTPTQSPDRITTPVPTASPATAPVTPTPAINNQVDEVASIAQSGPATPETPKKKKKKSKKAKKHAPGETPPATPQAKPMATPMTPPRLPTSAPASPPHKPSPTKTKTKKNKKKSRSHSWSDDAFPSPPKTKLKSQSMGGKMVTWGYVQAREFLRCPGGGSAVPSEGAWALGLGKHVGDVSLGSVDNVVSATEKAKSNFERVARLTERERKKVLMTAEDEWQAANASLDTAPAKSTTNARQRRLSISNDDCDAHVFATLSHEQASEFALIRTSREEHCGCSCGDLVKKVSKMHIKKLVAWLHERDVDTAHMSKPELMMRAKTLAAEEKNCATEDCECARNGVPCHQDTCSGCRGNCDNHRYTYNKDHVHAYRQELIAQWTCSNQLDV